MLTIKATLGRVTMMYVI